MITQLEKAIVDFLTPVLPELLVEVYPEHVQEYHLTHPLGALLVFYKGSQYSEFVIGPVCMRAITFVLNLQMRNLRTHSGAYKVLERVRKKIHGQELCGATFHPLKESFVGMKNGIWEYDFEIATSIPAVSAYEYPGDELLAASAQQIDFQESTQEES